MNIARKVSLSKQLVLYTLATSSLLTTIFTLFSFYHDYRTETKKLLKTFEHIEKVVLPPLSQSIYNFDEPMVHAQVDSLLSLIDVVSVKVLNDDAEEMRVKQRKLSDYRFLTTKKYNMNTTYIEAEGDYTGKKHQGLGTLVVVVTYDHMYLRLLEKALLFFAGQFVKTCIAAFLILMIFKYFVIRHLMEIINLFKRVKKLGVDSSHILSLDIKKNEGNEFIELQSAINEVLSDLRERSLESSSKSDFLLQNSRALNKYAKKERLVYNIMAGLFLRDEVECGDKLVCYLRELDDVGEYFYHVYECPVYKSDKAGPYIKWADLDSAKPRVSYSERFDECFYYKDKVFFEFQDGVTIPVFKGDKLQAVICAPDCTIKKLIKDPEFIEYLTISAGINLENFSFRKILQIKVDMKTAILLQKNEDLHNALEQLKETQDQLLKSEKIASLGRMVAGVAHELNTPIGAALTEASNFRDQSKEIGAAFASQTLKRKVLEKYFENVGEGCENLTFSLQRAAELISTFKQISVDQSVEIERELNLYNYLDATMKTLMPELKKKDVSYTLEGTKDILIWSYAGVFSQILMNLTMNALTHAFVADENAKHRVLIELTDDKERLYLKFIDNGVGMPNDVIDKIFDPFFSTKFGAGGTGLGLNIVYNLVNGKLKGKITCSSEIGVGTTFHIEIPKIMSRQAA